MYLIMYPFAVLGSLLATLLTYILAPLLALAINSTTGNLPRWLYWFQTFDATCFEGRQAQYGFTGSNWWVATQWLWRNPAYGFDYWPFGVAMDVTQWTVTRNDGAWFIARGPGGQFNIEYGGRLGSLKLGWKAKNYRTSDLSAWLPASYSWGPSRRTSICFTVRP